MATRKRNRKPPKPKDPRSLDIIEREVKGIKILIHRNGSPLSPEEESKIHQAYLRNEDMSKYIAKEEESQDPWDNWKEKRARRLANTVNELPEDSLNGTISLYDITHRRSDRIYGHFNKWGQFQGYSAPIDVGVAICIPLAFIGLIFFTWLLLPCLFFKDVRKEATPGVIAVILIYTPFSLWGFITLIEIIFG